MAFQDAMSCCHEAKIDRQQYLDTAKQIAFLMQVDGDHASKAEGGPMLTVELQLNAAEACFEPWLVGTSKPSVRQLFETWIQGCLDCAQLVTQVQTGQG